MTEKSKMSYTKGRIYTIRNFIDNEIYVGRTAQALHRRFQKHKSNINNDICKERKLYKKMLQLGVDNFYIELIEEFPCENIEQLRKREGELIREYNPAL